MTCFYELPPIGQEATIITHFVVREDAQLLYGFNTKQERMLFRELLKANGVGPKLAWQLCPACRRTSLSPVLSAKMSRHW